MPKKSAEYIDCKIKESKIEGDSENRLVSADFGNLRLKTISKLVQEGDKVKGHHKDVGYLLRELGQELRHRLKADLFTKKPEPVFSDKVVLIEFKIPVSDTKKAKQTLRRVLRKEFGLHVEIAK